MKNAIRVQWWLFVAVSSTCLAACRSSDVQSTHEHTTAAQTKPLAQDPVGVRTVYNCVIDIEPETPVQIKYAPSRNFIGNEVATFRIVRGHSVRLGNDRFDALTGPLSAQGATIVFIYNPANDTLQYQLTYNGTTTPLANYYVAGTYDMDAAYVAPTRAPSGRRGADKIAFDIRGKTSWFTILDVY